MIAAPLGTCHTRTNVGELSRHMEDGCSKRFDIGTLNLQGTGFAGLGIVSPNRTSVLDPRRPG